MLTHMDESRRLVFLDFETRSQLDLKKVGSRMYAKHHSTEVISVSWCLLTGPVYHSVAPSDLSFRPEDVLVAHNYSFERDILRFVLRRSHGRWCDTMALAAQLSLPLGLEALAEFFGLEKDMVGHKAMRKLSRPRPKSKANPDRTKFWEYEDRPDDFESMYDYNENDVDIMREIYKRLLPLSKREQRIWELTERMNERGILIDLPGVRKAKALVSAEEQLLSSEFERMAGCSPRSPKKVAAVLGLPNAKAETIKKAVVANGDHVRARLLELRKLLGRSSVAKLDGFLLRTDDDARLHGSFVYAGAQRTGRWASKGVQLHNLPRGAGKATEPLFDLLHEGALEVAQSPLEIMPELLRGFVEGPLLVGDYAQIEARALSWLAGDEEMVEVFRKKGDPYKLMASQVFRVSEDKVSKDQRFLGKQCVLGAGYGMGPAKFIATCDKLSDGKIKPSMEEAKRIIDMYRMNRSAVKEFWYYIEGQFRDALEGRPNQWYQGVQVGGVRYIRAKLPSGRYLYYAKPKQGWETDPKSGRNYNVIRYWGQNTYTRQWEFVKTYGGKLVENMIQALCRDLLAGSMLRMEDNELEVLLTVHDEIGAKDDGRSLDEFKELMEFTPEWAKGLPVEVEVFRCARYRK